MKILVVAAHPDDEVLGCGGAIARLSQEGHDIHFAIVGEGMTSRGSSRDQTDPHQLSRLHRQAHAAAECLGVKVVTLFGLPDNRLDTIPLLEIVKLLEELVESVRPEVVYTHHPGDLNIDHGVVHRAVLTATRPMSGQCVREVYTFEVPSSTDWAFQRPEHCFRPNVFIDITRTLAAKISSFACYDTEAREFPHPRSAEALRATATRWGSVVGCRAAEAFELIRSIRLENHRR
jgi:LmbE family N-acetylglucosaminyl deacetylase